MLIAGDILFKGMRINSVRPIILHTQLNVSVHFRVSGTLLVCCQNFTIIHTCIKLLTTSVELCAYYVVKFT